MTTPAIGIIARGEEPLIQVCCGLQTESASPAVKLVTGKNRIDGSNINLVGLSRLDRVLDQRIEGEHDILESLNVLDLLDEDDDVQNVYHNWSEDT